MLGDHIHTFQVLELLQETVAAAHRRRHSAHARSGAGETLLQSCRAFLLVGDAVELRPNFGSPCATAATI